MSLRNKKAFRAIALLLAFSVTQVYVHADLVNPRVAVAVNGVVMMPVQATAKLVTRGNQSILVNGNPSTTGATILTGAEIETPEAVGATINLGPLGSLDLAPNSRVRLEFSEGTVRVTLISGCAILRTKRKTVGTIATSQGDAGKTDATKDGVVDVCFPAGATSPVVNQGAAANAGAGTAGGAATGGAASGTGAATGEAVGAGSGTGAAGGAATGGAGGGIAQTGGAGAGGGISTTAVVIGAIVMSAAVIGAVTIPCRRGRNPSPGTPRGTGDCDRGF